jgi:hypothetical protein
VDEGHPKRGDMRQRNGIILAVVGCIVFFFCMEGWGADWKYYIGNEFGEYYYDAENLNRLPDTIVRVWTKEISSQKSVADTVGRLGQEYKDLGHINTLWEVDCIAKKSRVLAMAYYSKSNSLIDSADNLVTEWNFIIPDSMWEYLSKAVCKQLMK